MEGAVMTQKLKCGDTEWCDQCAQKQETVGAPEHLTMNALGRCDFYRSKNEQGRPNPIGSDAPINT